VEIRSAAEAVAGCETASSVKPAAFTAAKTSPVVIAEATITAEATLAAEATVITEATEVPVAEAAAFKAVEPAEPVVMEPAEAAVTESPDKKPTPVGRIPMIEVVPGADSDEDSVHKIIGGPVSVMGTIIRIVGIKPVLANRGRIIETVIRADSDAHSDLALRIDRRHHH